MAGTNPFASKSNAQADLFIDTQDAAIDESVLEEAIQAELAAAPSPTAWQRVMSVLFGDGVAHLSLVAVPEKRISKRRLRRLRGRAKELRRTA